MSTTAELTIENRVATVTLQNAEGLNLLEASSRQALGECLSAIEGANNIRVVVLAATGKVFLAGADLKEIHALDAQSALDYAEAGQQLCNRLEDLPCLTIARIHGACMGGGCEIALACDFRVMAREAKIGLPEVGLGVIPGWGGTYRTVRELGLARARQLVLFGKPLTGEQAFEIGLVQHLAGRDELDGVIAGLSADAACPAPRALARAKEVLLSHTPIDRKAALALEARAFADCFDTDEPEEGITSFREKRSPRWAE